jgi:hypothetical protein
MKVHDHTDAKLARACHGGQMRIEVVESDLTESATAVTDPLMKNVETFAFIEASHFAGTELYSGRRWPYCDTDLIPKCVRGYGRAETR